MGQFILHRQSIYALHVWESIITQLSKNTRQRALLCPDATFPSPDDKEDDGGALADTGRCPDYRATNGCRRCCRGSQHTAHRDILWFTLAPAVK